MVRVGDRSQTDICITYVQDVANPDLVKIIKQEFKPFRFQRKYFDISYNDLHCGEENWELAERKLVSDSMQQAVTKRE
ncbi:Stage V sporulation protein AD [Bacillus cereus Rock3-29]|nr:Stage V sporulation protein AD [Bacillus cereus Rock3-29]